MTTLEKGFCLFLVGGSGRIVKHQGRSLNREEVALQCECIVCVYLHVYVHMHGTRVLEGLVQNIY